MGTAGEHRRGRAEGDARGHLVGTPRRPEPAGEGEVVAWLGERPDHGARARGRRRCSSALRSCGPGTASGRAGRTGARRPGVLGENSMAQILPRIQRRVTTHIGCGVSNPHMQAAMMV